MEAVASLKEQLLTSPVAASQMLKVLETSGTSLKSGKPKEKQTRKECDPRMQETASPGHDVGQVCKIYLECLDHCLWRLDNLQEKLHQEEEEYSALLKRQQRGYSPMRTNVGKVKQKAIASSEASKFKERIIATNQKKEEMESLFYSLLSLSRCVDVASMRKLFPRMIVLCYEKKLLVVNKVYMPLLSSSTKCLKAFCEREGEYLLNKFYEKTHDLTHGLMLLTHSKMREIFYVCVRNSKHLMEIFFEHLSNSLSSIKDLESQEFLWLRPLWPLLYMQTVMSSQGVAEYTGMAALLKKHNIAIDPLLAEVCSLLERDMRLVQWCLAHSSKLKTQPLLQLVRDHSPLYVIHKALQLKTLVPSDVLLMLQEHCMARDSSGVLNSSCRNAYMGFCILIQMFEIIGSGMQLDNISTGWQTRKRSHSCKIPGSNETNSFQESQCHSSFYKKNITEKLKSVQKLLDSLQPLTYKLELMENIYSLLFVRHSDMSDEDNSEASAEEGEMDQSLPSQHTDADSLMSLSASTNPHYPARDSPDPTCITASHNNNDGATRKKVLDFSEYVVLDENGIERVNFSSKQSSISSTSAHQPVSKSSSPEGKDQEEPVSNELMQWESQRHSSQSGEAAAQRLSSCTGVSGKSATSSTGELPCTGFLINTLVAWDIMLMLKEVLFVFTSECFRQMSNEEASSRQDVESRVSYLSMCVNEGLWRLQVMVPGTHSFGSLDIFDDYLNGTLFSHASQQLVYESPTPLGNTKKKLGKDPEPPQIRGSSSEPNSVINFLFAPSSSLITMSLANGNVERIEKIFRAFEIADTADKREAQLAMRLNQLRPKLSVTHQRSARPRDSKVIVDGGSSQGMLQCIGLLAREGTAQVGATNLIHDLVTSLPPPIPKGIPEAAVVTECPVTASFLNPMALVLADLALTVDVTETTATYILEQVFQKHPLQNSDHKHVETCSGIVGYLPILHQLQAACRTIVSLRESEKEPGKGGSSCDAGSGVDNSISICLDGQVATPFSLLMSYLPLKNEELKAHVYGWSKVLRSVSAVQEALLSTTIDKDDLTNVMQRLNSQNNRVHHTYKTLIRTLSSEAPHLSGRSSRGKSTVKVGAYVRSFYQYLQLMSAMVTQHAEKRYSKMGSHFSLLSERPVEILGSLIFQECVDPVRLEPIASKMKLNLTSMILQYCCPKFTIPRENSYPASLSCSAKGKVHALGFEVVREQVIMNSGTITCQDGVYGEVVVQSLLTSLLSSLHEATQSSMVISQTGLRALVLNDATAPRFLTQVDVKETLKDTADLSAVDFNKMRPGREAVVFFINLANLMFIHAGLLNHVLYPSSKLNPQARGVFSNYQLERICAMRRLGYVVGQLGFVSLYDVLYTVLQLQNPLSSILVQNDPINRISICESNLICTKLLPKREELSSVSELLEPLSSRISFCVTQGTSVSPRVQVLFVDRLEEQLEEAVQEHMRLFFIAQTKRKRKQSVDTQERHSKKGTEKCKVVTSRTVLDYLAGRPTSIVGGMQKLQKSMPLEMAAVMQEFISELSKGKQLEIDVLDREESRGIVLEIIESFEEEAASDMMQDEAQSVLSMRELPGPLWEGSRLPQAVLTYLRRQCPLLSFIVQVFHHTAEISKKGDGAEAEDNIDYADLWLKILYPPSLGIKPPEEETKRFWPVKNLFSLQRHRALARIYGNNKVPSALTSSPDISSIWELADSLLGSCSITRGHKSPLQQHTTALVAVLQSLPPSTRESHPDLTLFLDQLLVFLVQATSSKGKMGKLWVKCDYFSYIPITELIAGNPPLKKLM